MWPITSPIGPGAMITSRFGQHAAVDATHRVGSHPARRRNDGPRTRSEPIDTAVGLPHRACRSPGASTTWMSSRWTASWALRRRGSDTGGTTLTAHMETVVIPILTVPGRLCRGASSIRHPLLWNPPRGRKQTTAPAPAGVSWDAALDPPDATSKFGTVDPRTALLLDDEPVQGP